MSSGALALPLNEHNVDPGGQGYRPGEKEANCQCMHAYCMHNCMQEQESWHALQNDLCACSCGKGKNGAPPDAAAYVRTSYFSLRSTPCMIRISLLMRTGRAIHV